MAVITLKVAKSYITSFRLLLYDTYSLTNVLGIQNMKKKRNVLNVFNVHIHLTKHKSRIQNSYQVVFLTNELKKKTYS
jgi:hypothetical protein